MAAFRDAGRASADLTPQDLDALNLMAANRASAKRMSNADRRAKLHVDLEEATRKLREQTERDRPMSVGWAKWSPAVCKALDAFAAGCKLPVAQMADLWPPANFLIFGGPI